MAKQIPHPRNIIRLALDKIIEKVHNELKNDVPPSHVPFCFSKCATTEPNEKAGKNTGQDT